MSKRAGEYCESCRKWRFPSRWHADQAAKRARRRGERISTYRCPASKYGHHFGHSTPMVRIDD